MSKIVEYKTLEMVVGFIFSPNMEDVVLIRKINPEWQRGRLNGIDGKKEPYERRAVDTMVRECREETGLEIAVDQWKMFAELVCVDTKTRVVFFFAKTENYGLATSREEENVFVYKADMVCMGTIKEFVPNLIWLIPLARTFDQRLSDTEMDHVVILEKLHETEEHKNLRGLRRDT